MQLWSYVVELAHRATPTHWKHFLLQCSVCALAVVAVYLWKRRSLRGFIGYCLPRDLFRWAVLTDIAYAIIRKLVFPFIVSPLVVGPAVVAPVVYHWLGEAPVAPASWYVIEAIALTSFLVGDFTYYWVHRFHHTVPLLWEFHKIHHSAKFLTLAVAPREHPVEVLLNNALPALMIGVFIGATSYMAGVDIIDTGLAAVDIGAVIYFVGLGTLRHSHFYISFGRVLESVFISPALHQIHHSARDEHLDRNYGFNLALWDWMFGTLVYATPHQTIRWGLHNPAEEQDYDTVFKLWFMPFIRLARTTTTKVRAIRGAAAGRLVENET